MIDPGPILALLARLQEQVMGLEVALAQAQQRVRELEQQEQK